MTDGVEQFAPVAAPRVERKKGMMRRGWDVLCKPSKFSLLVLVAGGFFAGIIFWGGFNTAIEATNRLEFCIGCHEMHDTVYQEYKKSTHFANRSGVRAICSDCHVPKDWMHKMARKIEASGEIYGKLIGTIDTPEKFEARRGFLAEKEWARMKANDSRECRNCHSYESMLKKAQTSTAWRRHKKALTTETCIDCHKAMAHREPAGMKKPEDPDAAANSAEAGSKSTEAAEVKPEAATAKQ